MKILVDIPDSQLQSLNNLSKARKSSRSALVRNAVDAYLATQQRPMSDFIGLWARATEPAPEGLGMLDGMEYQDKLRSEW